MLLLFVTLCMNTQDISFTNIHTTAFTVKATVKQREKVEEMFVVVFMHTTR